MKITEAKWIENFKQGKIDGESVEVSYKMYAQAKSFYASEDASLPQDTLMYTVYTCQTKNDHTQNLNWGLTVMEPVCVHQECNVTRGHFHEDEQCDEIYICQKGEGLLLFMDEKGQCHAEAMREGSIHHIDGTLAHRMVNTSDSKLEVMCCWPVNAGHDYKRVEEMPFSVRVFRENGKITIKENR